MVDVLVEHEYVGQEDDELTIKPGDIITNVIKADGGWWEGTLNGKSGMFPDNFVKEFQEVPKKEKTKVQAGVNKKPVQPEGGNVADMANRLGNLKHGPGPIPANEPKKTHAKVTFAYNPQHEDELKLEIGNIVEVTKQEEEGWWEGSLNGKSGMFPSNFVEVIEEASSEEHSKDEDEVREIKGKKNPRVGFGNIFEGGPIKLRSVGSKDEEAKKTTENKAPVTQAKKATASPAKEPPVVPPKEIKEPKPVERARVLFSYEAENDDELNLEEGSVINVLDKQLEDSGWWKGELNGKIGVFPDNFVTLLPPEERPRKPPPPTVPQEAKRTRPVSQASVDKIKKEEVKEDKKAAGRRPAQVPQAKKTEKQQIKSEQKLVAQTDDMKAQEQNMDESDKFLGTEPTDQKLSHPTATRVRAPIRRPPGAKKEEDKRTPPARAARPPPPTPSKDETPKSPVLRPKSPVLRPTSPAEDQKDSQPPAKLVDAAAVNALRKELIHLQANTVSREDYLAIQADLRHIREDMDKMRNIFNKKLLDLMKEVDEEKKIRLNMQVEMDRVKKLVVGEDNM